jgi:hypothetical protein
MISSLTIRRATACVAILLLAGCAAYTLVNPERQTVGDVISVQPGLKWNKVASHNFQGKVELWTIDGTVLNTLVYFTGVPDGEPLFTRRVVPGAGKPENPPVFKASMNPVEIQELLEATVARHFQTTLAEGRNLKPVPIADGRGFRFETRLVGRDEVERAGVFVGTIRNRKLYGAWFQGARLHYYDRYLPEFDRIVSSAQFVGEAASK